MSKWFGAPRLGRQRTISLRPRRVGAGAVRRSRGLSVPSRPEEFHLESLTDLDVNPSIHPPRVTH